MSLQHLSASTKLPGILPRTTDNLFGPRHWLAEDALILGPPLEPLWPRLISLLINTVSSGKDISSSDTSSSSDWATGPKQKWIMNSWAQYPYRNHMVTFNNVLETILNPILIYLFERHFSIGLFWCTVLRLPLKLYIYIYIYVGWVQVIPVVTLSNVTPLNIF